MKKMMPKIGLALGSGGARGMAHLGVLQRLIEWEVPIHCVAGTSIGAIMGGVFVSGKVAEAVSWVETLDWRKAASLFAEIGIPKTGFIAGRRIEATLRKFIKARTYRELPLPFATVATDIATGERVVIDRGSLIQGIHASFSIPGVFMTVSKNGRQLVDGGLVDPLPVDVCRSLGAEKVIAVDINLTAGGAPERRKKRELPLFDVLANTVSVIERETVRHSLAKCAPDVFISPAVGSIATLEFKYAASAIAAGRAAADEARDAIMNLWTSS